MSRSETSFSLSGGGTGAGSRAGRGGAARGPGLSTPPSRGRARSSHAHTRRAARPPASLFLSPLFSFLFLYLKLHSPLKLSGLPLNSPPPQGQEQEARAPGRTYQRIVTEFERLARGRTCRDSPPSEPGAAGLDFLSLCSACSSSPPAARSTGRRPQPRDKSGTSLRDTGAETLVSVLTFIQRDTAAPPPAHTHLTVCLCVPVPTGPDQDQNQNHDRITG